MGMCQNRGTPQNGRVIIVSWCPASKKQTPSASGFFVFGREAAVALMRCLRRVCGWLLERCCILCFEPVPRARTLFVVLQSLESVCESAELSEKKEETRSGCQSELELPHDEGCCFEVSLSEDLE